MLILELVTLHTRVISINRVYMVVNNLTA